MGVEEHKEAAEAIGQISFAVITVSDSRHEAEDESGKLIRERVQEAGHRLVGYQVLKDDLAAIQREISHLVEAKVGCIITSGGTGVGRRDVTIEGVAPLLDKSLEGFGEIFRYCGIEKLLSTSHLRPQERNVITTYACSFMANLNVQRPRLEIDVPADSPSSDVNA